MSKIRFDDNVIYFENGNFYKFDCKISEVLTVGDIVVISLDYRAPSTNNIYGFSKNGEKIWRVGSVPSTIDVEESSYTLVRTDIENTLYLCSFDSFAIWIDLQSGKCLKKVYTRL